jgi:4-oxalocrotonate tautomerase
MPFVNIRLYEGHGKERKDEIARRVTETLSDVCKVPREAVWVVFEDVPPPDWYVAGTPGTAVKK